MEMPGYLDYQKMAMQDPMAYGQSLDQLGLAKLFQAEKQKQEESKTLADMMANDQSQQMNPLLVQQQRLVNTGKDTANQDAGLTLERNKAMQSTNLNADQRAAALKLSDDQLKSAQQKIELDYMSGDPERIKRAQQFEPYLAAIRAEKRKQADEMEKTRLQGENSLRQTNATIAGQRGIEQMRIDAGKYDRSKVAISVDNRLNMAKNAKEKAEILENAYYTAVDNGDMQAAERYKQRALEARQRAAEDTPYQPGPTLNIPGGGQPPEMINKPRPTATAPIAGGAAKLPPGVRIIGQ